ncbi:MAG: hypothetical protein H6715_01325 [Myxococcales bacterium]|nr:hypothetical protein [Myxococcales bacterium]MCB9708937.1 hypothetical protein [Myxococcales bacterium]
MKTYRLLLIGILALMLFGCYVSTRPGPHTREIRTREVHRNPPPPKVVQVEKPAPAPQPKTYRAHSTTIHVGQSFRVFGRFDTNLRGQDVGFRFAGVSQWLNASHVTRTEVRCEVPKGARTGNVELAIRGTVVWMIRIIVMPEAQKPKPAPAPVSYRLEPQEGAVGDIVTLHGSFAESVSAKDYRFKFEGATNAVKPESVSKRALTVKVPKKATTGELIVRENGKAMWKGSFKVLPRKTTDVAANITVERLEPTVGPVGTTVTLYGKFPNKAKPADFMFAFNGPKALFAAKKATQKKVSTVVPKSTVTGPISVMYKRETIWEGTFRVTQESSIAQPTPGERGLRGEIWKLPDTTKNLPDFSTLGTPFATITVPKLNVAPRRFEEGFPGATPNQEPLLEWFAIRFSGKLEIPNDGEWGFQTTSDDGVKLYIDGKQVLVEDGVHPPKDTEASVNLTKGQHDIVVEYFQGPRYYIALVLRWRKDAKNDKEKWQVIPSRAFSRD